MSDRTMQALVYDRARDPWEATTGLRLDRVAAPVLDEALDPGDADRVLVRPRFAGFCGSDRSIWFRRAFRSSIEGSLAAEQRTARVIGHELFGEVVAVGSRAADSVRVDDTVSTESHIICGVCFQCRAGDTHVCADDKTIGISTDGCFAELIKLPARVLWKTDTSKIRPEVAAIQEPFGNAVYACTKVPLAGKRVAIVGCGTIGLFAIAVARAMGATQIIGVEPAAEHQRMALALGADHVLAPAIAPPGVTGHDRELAGKIRELTGGVGVDVALEMSGFNTGLNNAIAATRRGGDVILFGIKSGEAVIESFDRLVLDGISLHAVVGRRIFATWEVTRRLLESRSPNIHDLIWEVILKGGRDTVVDFASFEPAAFAERITRHPKVLLRFA